MNDARYERASAGFLAALEVPAHERAGFVTQFCQGDEQLERAVNDLLAADRPTDIDFDFGDLRLANAVDDPTLLFPEIIGRYQVLNVLGYGASGVVLRAQQKGLDREVALKLQHPDVDSEQLSSRLAIEAHLLGQLDHPGIVRVIETGSYETPQGSRIFLAMDLVEGVPIPAYCEENKLNHRARWELLAKLADAIQHAHHRGIIHRDLKPANVLVANNGEPRILDFGIARPMASGDGITLLDGGSHSVVGTMGYMSPEQLRGDVRAVDMRTDVYSLGVITYEILAGQAPFAPKAQGALGALRRLLNHDPEPLGDLDRTLRGDATAIVAKAMDPTKERRYATAEMFADDIRRLLARKPIAARPQGWFEQALRAMRRHGVATVAIVGLIVSLTVGILVKSAAVADVNQEVDLLKRVVEQLIVFLNDPGHSADGALLTMDSVTIQEKFLTAGPFIENQAKSYPAAAGVMHQVVGRTLSVGATSPANNVIVQWHYQRAFDLLKQELGSEHLRTLHALRDLTGFVVRSGDISAGEEILRSLQLTSKDLAASDPKFRFQLAMVNVALLRKLDRPDEALASLKQVIPRARAELGSQDTMVLGALMTLASLLPREDALTLLAEVEADVELAGRPRARLLRRSLQNALLVQRAVEDGDSQGTQLSLEALRACVSEAEAIYGPETLISRKMIKALNDALALSNGL